MIVKERVDIKNFDETCCEKELQGFECISVLQPFDFKLKKMLEAYDVIWMKKDETAYS